MFEIRRGQTVKCLHCDKDILLDENTFVLDCVAEYIICPHCGEKDDVQKYLATPIPYKVGDKFITMGEKHGRYPLNFYPQEVKVLSIEKIDCDNGEFPHIIGRDENGKMVRVNYCFAPHFQTIEEAEREVKAYNEQNAEQINHAWETRYELLNTINEMRSKNGLPLFVVEE